MLNNRNVTDCYANGSKWKDDLADFIFGPSFNMQLGPGFEYSPGNGFAALLGTPGIGVSYMWEAKCR